MDCGKRLGAGERVGGSKSGRWSVQLYCSVVDVGKNGNRFSSKMTRRGEESEKKIGKKNSSSQVLKAGQLGAGAARIGPLCCTITTPLQSSAFPTSLVCPAAFAGASHRFFVCFAFCLPLFFCFP